MFQEKKTRVLHAGADSGISERGGGGGVVHHYK